MDVIDKKIKNAVDVLYDQSTYSDKYGLQLWIVFVITIMVFLACSYYYILNNIQPIKANWHQEKCNPIYMPFAGVIHDKKGDDFWKFTAENFSGCLNTILQKITNYAFLPFYYAMNVISSIFLVLINALAVMREMFDKMRNSAKSITSVIFDRIFNITAPILELFIIIKSTIAKVAGTFTAVIYSLVASFMGLQSFYQFLLKVVVAILVIIAVIIIVLMPFSFFPPILVVAVLYAEAMGRIVVAVVSIIAFAVSTLGLPIDLEVPKVPSTEPPACFDGNTQVTLQNGKVKSFSKLEIGDIIKDGSQITGVLKLALSNNKMYNLDGILVTENHPVFHEEKGWISVSKHENAKIVLDYCERYVYCIVTNTKIISIGNYVFLDWDEVDDYYFDILYKNCPLLPINSKITDIHQYMVSGINGDTIINLIDGTRCKLKNIEPDDILEGGDKVIGVVKIDARSVNMNASIENCYLYHLITDSKMFICDGIKIKDFNSYIESYLLH